MKTKVSFLTLAFSGLLLSACGGGGGGGSAPPPPAQTLGTLSASITDAPACGFDAVNITVNKVRVHQSGSASDTDSGWTDITLSPAKKINLLNLTNGVLESLGQTSLPAGNYTQVRLVLDPTTQASPANTVTPTGSTETAMETPSGTQSGIKVLANFTVTAGQTTDLVLDFDACKSVVTKGNGRYALKPVVKAIPPALNGITGFIASTMLSSNVNITAQQNGAVIAATVPSSSGAFSLARLPVGNYDVVITADGRAATVIGAVPVTTTTSIVQLSTTGSPLALSTTSLQGSISGTATLAPVSTTESALLSAKQAISGGPTVTLRYAMADLASGAYTISKLPLSAPQYTVYSANLPLGFVSVATTPTNGRYRVDASATGYASQSNASVDISAADATGVNFSLVP